MDDFATLALGIPTVNQADYLNQALEVYKDTFHGRHIYIIDNGRQNINRPYQGIKILVQPKNIGVAASWNIICRVAFASGYTHVVIINDDVICEKYADLLEDYIDDVQAGLFIGYKNWSMFVISYDTFNAIGEFDENFKGAYFEDNDYLWRCKQAGIIIEQTELMNPEQYQQSMSIKTDPSLNEHFENNKAYYIKKWGGVPTEEKYIKPFNK
jgi:GT2 family glycosyltransferase